MKYLVLEIQLGDTVSTIISDYDDLNQAESKYHQVLTAAAISNIYKHSAMIINEEGRVLKVECYIHE